MRPSDKRRHLLFLLELKEEFEMPFSESDIWEYGYGPSGHPDEGLYVQAGPGRPCPYCGRMPCICGTESIVIEQALQELQSVPSYVEREAK